MPPVHVLCSQILDLDIDGILHPAKDVVHVARLKVPAPLLAVQMRSQGRFVWLPKLEELLADKPHVGILVHSTWRMNYDMNTIAELLGPQLRQHLILPSPYRVDMEAPASDFIREALTWINGEREQFGAPALGLDDMLVLDDRTDVFGDDDEVRARLLQADPAKGLSDPVLRSQLADWTRGDNSFHQLHRAESGARACAEDHGEDVGVSPAPRF